MLALCLPQPETHHLKRPCQCRLKTGPDEHSPSIVDRNVINLVTPCLPPSNDCGLHARRGPCCDCGGPGGWPDPLVTGVTVKVDPPHRRGHSSVMEGSFSSIDM